jgi:integrase/recombinase XerC
MSARLRGLNGGGASAPEPPAECQICGAAHCRDCGYLTRHLDSLRAAALAQRTVGERRYAILRLARAMSAMDTTVMEATSRDLLKWRLGLRVTQSTAAGYLIGARRFYAWLQAEGLRPDNPAAALPVPPQPRRLPRPVPEKELMYAVLTAPPRIRPWLILAAWCGLRAIELSQLRADNITTTGPQPSLLVTIEATKGSRVERLIPLCPFVVAEIPSWDLPRSGWAFVRHDGQYWLPNSAQKISQLANQWLHASGTACTLHSLRHRFATQVYRQRHDLLTLAELLGHGHVTSTQIYAKADTSQTAADVAGLPTPPRHLRAAE